MVKEQMLRKEKKEFQLLTGGIAGGVSRTVTSPFERLKILRQCASPEYRNLGFLDSFHKFYTLEGLRGFFKGNGYNVLKVVPFTAIEFYIYETCKESFGRSKLSLFLSGSLAGSAATLLTYPLDLFKTFSSVQVKRPIHCLDCIYQRNGLYGYFKGLGMSLAGISSFIGIKMTLFDIFKSKAEPSTRNHFILGGAAGGTAMLLTYPTDLVRRKIQVLAFDDGKCPYKSATECVSFVYKNEGILGFYKGLCPSFLKITPTMAVVFAINEQLKTLFTY